MTEHSWRPLHSLILIGLALATLAWLTATQREWRPVSDEVEYLSIAWNLGNRGSFSMSAPEVSEPVPTAYREPGYPLLILAITRLIPSLAEASPACFFYDAPVSCQPQLAKFRTANSVMHVLAGLIVFAIARCLGATPIQALLAFALLAINPEAVRWRNQLLSDYLALLLMAGVTWGAVLMVQRPRFLTAALTGAAMSGLILTKAIFLYMLPFVLLAAGAFAATRRSGTRLKAGMAAALLLILASAPAAGWIARNHVAVDRASLSSERGGIALQSRVVYNSVTPTQYGVMVLWFIRAAGDNWARKLFPESATRAFLISEPDGFAVRGYDLFGERTAALVSTGMTPRAAEKTVERQLIGEILADLPKHLLVSIPFFYRGLFIDEYLVLTLPALAAFLIAAFKQRDIARLAALAAPLYCIAIHSLLTINTTRFVTPALVALALAGGFVLPRWGAALWRRWSIRRPA